MIYRQSIFSSQEMASWYDRKYTEMGGCWHTPDEELDRHLDDFGMGVAEVPGTVMVDIGCGDGSLVRRAMVRGYVAIGLELSAEAIKECPNLLIRDISASPLGFLADRIISLGSLEHIIDIDSALENIRLSLKPEGRWYFFVPNELWIHEDQPNERIATEEEWSDLFRAHGLVTDKVTRWNDCSALQGGLG